MQVNIDDLRLEIQRDFNHLVQSLQKGVSTDCMEFGFVETRNVENSLQVLRNRLVVLMCSFSNAEEITDISHLCDLESVEFEYS